MKIPDSLKKLLSVFLLAKDICDWTRYKLLYTSRLANFAQHVLIQSSLLQLCITHYIKYRLNVSLMVDHVDIPRFTNLTSIEYILILVDFERTHEITISLLDYPIHHKHVVGINLKGMTLQSELTSIFIWIRNS